MDQQCQLLLKLLNVSCKVLLHVYNIFVEVVAVLCCSVTIQLIMSINTIITNMLDYNNSQ